MLPTDGWGSGGHLSLDSPILVLRWSDRCRGWCRLPVAPQLSNLRRASLPYFNSSYLVAEPFFFLLFRPFLVIYAEVYACILTCRSTYRCIYISIGACWSLCLSLTPLKSAEACLKREMTRLSACSLQALSRGRTAEKHEAVRRRDRDLLLQASAPPSAASPVPPRIHSLRQCHMCLVVRRSRCVSMERGRRILKCYTVSSLALSLEKSKKRINTYITNVFGWASSFLSPFTRTSTAIAVSVCLL